MEILNKLTSALLVITILFMQTGCEDAVNKKNRIVMWLVGSQAQAETIMDISQTFTEKTGVEVICQAISWSDAHSKYLTSIAGDVSPDIGTMGLTWGMEFGELGAMVDLAAEYPEEVAGLEKKIFSGILESTRLGDKVYGIPFDLSEHIMYYRSDIVPDPPGTWDELINITKKLKAEDKGMILDWGSLDWIGFSPFLWQAGGDYYNEDQTKATLDTPEAIQAMEFFAELYENGMPKTQVPLEQGMRTGDYPLAISGNWKIISLTIGAPEIEGKWSISQLPKGPTGKRTAFIGGRILGIFSDSKRKKESWEFIKFLFDPENQVKLYEASLDNEDAYLPPNTDTWKTLPMDEKFKEVLESQARDAKGPPPVLSWDASTRFVNKAIQMVVLKGADPKTELKEATIKMQEELDGLE